MTMLVHITSEKAVPAIRRAGLRPFAGPGNARGVYCMPVLPNFYASHQWLREVKRGGRGSSFIGVYFRISADEEVLAGHYSEAMQRLRLGSAARIVMEAADPRGYQIFLPRGVPAKEIHRIRSLPQVVGWRYQPDSHGRPPCTCPLCMPRGAYGARKYRGRRVPEELTPRSRPKQLLISLLRENLENEIELQCLLDELAVRRRGNAAELRFLMDHRSEEVACALASALAAYRDRESVAMLQELCCHPASEVRTEAAIAILSRRGRKAQEWLGQLSDPVIDAVLHERSQEKG